MLKMIEIEMNASQHERSILILILDGKFSEHKNSGNLNHFTEI